MNQSGALESMVRAFLLQMVLRNSAQLLINEGDERLKRFLITGAPFDQEGADRLGRRFGHAHTLESAEDLGLGQEGRGSGDRSQLIVRQEYARSS